jgi:RNA polymerase sigma-70 factor, ECF subfamily
MNDTGGEKTGQPGDPDSISSPFLERVKQQRPEAWTRLADLYGPVVYRWCRQTGVSRDDAPDLVQEVFATVARHIDGFRRDRPGDSFAAWLRIVTRNAACDYFRSRQGKPIAHGGTDAQEFFLQVPDEVELSEANEPHEINSVVVPIGLELIRAEFEQNTWEAFRRGVIEKQPASRIALELGMSVAAVYQAKSRVLRRLRQELDGILE